MPRRYRSTRRQDPKQPPPAGGGRGAAGDPVGDPARGARRRAALEASLRNLSISSPSPERHRASLAASMARLAVADAQQEDTAFEDALRARQARTYHDNTVYHGMGCAVCRNRLWTGALRVRVRPRPRGSRRPSD